jgi:REP element-mobilizing transposase RayT
MPLKSRRTEALRKGRLSFPGTLYFLTWCTANRIPSLAENVVRKTAIHAINALDVAGNALVLVASIMPDHIHLLIELGTPLSVSQVVGKSKSAIARAHGEIRWRENFFEHRLRSAESAEDFAFYIFMNPYRAGLCPLDQKWAGWMSSGEVRWAFEDKLRPEGLPQPEWIEQANLFAQTLPPGAD